MSRFEPYTNFRFSVAIDGIDVIGFNRISGVSSNTSVTEYRPLGRFRPKLLPEFTTFEPIVLKRGICYESYHLQEWRDQVHHSILSPGIPLPGARRHVVIRLHDKARWRYSIEWSIQDAWPSSLKGPEFDASGEAIAFEEMILQNEGQYRKRIAAVSVKEQFFTGPQANKSASYKLASLHID